MSHGLFVSSIAVSPIEETYILNVLGMRTLVWNIKGKRIVDNDYNILKNIDGGGFTSDGIFLIDSKIISSLRLNFFMPMDEPPKV